MGKRTKEGGRNTENHMKSDPQNKKEVNPWIETEIERGKNKNIRETKNCFQSPPSDRSSHLVRSFIKPCVLVLGDICEG